MITPTYKQLYSIAKSKGYAWFTEPYDLNFIGIRSNAKHDDTFNDTIAVAYKDADGNERVFCAPFTCDPGKYYLRNPMNAKGTAIIPEGQYRSFWMLGKHKGYVALVQRKAIRVLRDNDKNDLLGGTLSVHPELGGFNFHRALENSIAKTIGKFSAGCQVVQVPEDFSYIISLVRLQVKYVKSAIVSYTLINEKDIDANETD